MAVEPQGAVKAGQAVYTPLTLKLYDAWVLGVSNRWLWRCPTSRLRSLYDRNVSQHHLDIGVGTGYYLDHARWPVPDPRITLVDLNTNSLDVAARRIARFSPRTIRADVLQPLPSLGPFQSAGLCYLLHCLPGSLEQKAVVFDNIRPLLAKGARVFGATIVQGSAPLSLLAQRLMDVYNSKGIFSNRDDRAEDLERELEARFKDVLVCMVGTVAVFEASTF